MPILNSLMLFLPQTSAYRNELIGRPLYKLCWRMKDKCVNIK